MKDKLKKDDFEELFDPYWVKIVHAIQDEDGATAYKECVKFFKLALVEYNKELLKVSNER